jgi:hypothetical protein
MHFVKYFSDSSCTSFLIFALVLLYNVKTMYNFYDYRQWNNWKEKKFAPLLPPPLLPKIIWAGQYFPGVYGGPQDNSLGLVSLVPNSHAVIENRETFEEFTRQLNSGRLILHLS